MRKIVKVLLRPQKQKKDAFCNDVRIQAWPAED